MRLRFPPALVALCAAAPLLAQAMPQGTPGDPVTAEDTAPGSVDQRARLIAMDTDHDGQWSKAEWLAGGRKERGFDLMDTDKDGKLTGAELKAGMARMQSKRAKPQ